MDKKVKAGSVAIGICLLVIAVLLAGIVYFFYNANIEKNNYEAKISELETTIKEKDNKVNELENDSEDKLQIPSVYVADTKNLIKGANYGIVVQDSCYYLSLINNKIAFSFSKDENELKPLVDFFEIEKNDIKIEPHEIIEVTGFSKNVVDVLIGYIGHDYSQALFIFLMEDGTVEYSDVKNMLMNVNTQGKIDGLKNIVRIQNVDVSDPEGGGYVSILAIDKNNVAYDISNYIDN